MFEVYAHLSTLEQVKVFLAALTAAWALANLRCLHPVEDPVESVLVLGAGVSASFLVAAPLYAIHSALWAAVPLAAWPVWTLLRAYCVRFNSHA